MQININKIKVPTYFISPRPNIAPASPAETHLCPTHGTPPHRALPLHHYPSVCYRHINNHPTHWISTKCSMNHRV